KAQCAADASFVLGGLVRGNPALASEHLPRSVDALHAPIKQILIHLGQQHVIARLRRGLGDTAAHQAAADNTNLLEHHRSSFLSDTSAPRARYAARRSIVPHG